MCGRVARGSLVMYMMGYSGPKKTSSNAAKNESKAIFREETKYYGGNQKRLTETMVWQFSMFRIIIFRQQAFRSLCEDVLEETSSAPCSPSLLLLHPLWVPLLLTTSTAVPGLQLSKTC